MSNTSVDNPISRMLVAVVQEQDVTSAVRALKRLNYGVTRLPSLGGFLGRRSSTLLIGIPRGKDEAALKTLQKNCRTRVEYVTVPLEGTPLPIPAPTPITVGGATIFTLEVERYEEF